MATCRGKLMLLHLLLSAASPLAGSGANLSTDASALLAFKSNLLLGASRTVLASWNASSSAAVCSSWEGVSCANSSSQGLRVTSLRLPGKSLYGPIAPGTLSQLAALDTLSLHHNKLSGAFPSDFSNLSSLKKLYLEHNELVGPLPLNFSSWPLLAQLDLSYNNFAGAIPPSLGALSHLRSLYLQNNSLVGGIPEEVGGLLALESVSVANNELDGPIPAALARFSGDGFGGNRLCGAPLEACEGQQKKRGFSGGAIAGIAVGCATFLAVALLMLLVLWGGRRGKRSKSGDGRGTASATGQQQDQSTTRKSTSASYVTAKESLESGGSRGRLVFFEEGGRCFNLEDLLTASAEVLGRGSLGTAYKAVLGDGSVYAVKRLQDVAEGGEEDGEAPDAHRLRLHSLGRLRPHPNLLPMRAYYFDRQEKLLVYDYLPLGSVSALLHGTGAAMGWEARCRAARSAARGLTYLHSQGVVHGNVKASNVLLLLQREGEAGGEACVADYGLVQLASAPPTQQGYQAPELLDPRRPTHKSDVFSFGVLLLELLTGKAPSHSHASSDLDDSVDLPRWVQSVVREDWTVELFDAALVQGSREQPGEGPPRQHRGDVEEQMVKLLQVALPCVAPSPPQRPTMAEVLRRMESSPPLTIL